MSGDGGVKELHPLLRDAVVDRLRWPDFREIQSLAFGPITAGNDVVLTAPTAGGKTEAAALPLLNAECLEPRPCVSVVWVAPLRALVENIADRLAPLAQALGRTAAAWHGDTPDSARRALLDEPPNIVVTTPEALEAMYITRHGDRATVDALGVRPHTRSVVVDEVHAFAGTARGCQLLSLLRRLDAAPQRIGLSATVGDPLAVLDWLGDTNTRPRSLIAAPSRPKRRRTGVVRVDDAAVPAEVAQLALGLRALVFAPTRNAVERLTIALRNHGIDAWPHHAGLSRRLRLEAETAFGNNAPSPGAALVCTSTLELGVDLPNVDRVVQIGPPPTAAALVQRMGRSGRRDGRIAELAIVVSTADDEQRAFTLLARAKSGAIETPVFGERHNRLLRQQFLARVAAGEHDEATLLSTLATLPGLRDFAPDDHIATLDALVAADHLRRHAGELFVGDRPAPFTEVCSVFEEPAGKLLRDESGAEVGEVRAAVGERVILGGREWIVGEGGLRAG